MSLPKQESLREWGTRWKDTSGVARAALDALDRIATLEAELASARLDAPLAWKEVARTEAEVLVWQAHANALRDALEKLIPDMVGSDQEYVRALLAQTPAASLRSHDAEVLERAAAECVGRAARNAELASIWDRKDESTARKWQLRSVEASDCAGSIRALAAQEVKP